jgi:hypothetical protein
MGIVERYRRMNHNSVVGRANEAYNVMIYDDELWLTCNGALVCPCSMLKDEPVDAVEKMRKLFVERKEKAE